MTMFFRGMFNRGTLPLLEKVVEFTEQRQNVLAHNIANIDTPFYRTRDLDTKGFERMVREAIDRRRSSGDRQIEFGGTRQLRIEPDGALDARTIRRRSGNILFHDQSNRNVEEEMAELAKNQMLHNLATALLKGQFGQLEMAIRGKL